jgi:hypothetical protein
MTCVLPAVLAYRRDDLEDVSLHAVGDVGAVQTNSSRSWDDIVVKATSLYKKVDVVLSAPLVEDSRSLLSAWSLSTAGQTVIPAVGIIRDGMAVGSRVNAQSELADSQLLASVEGDLLEVFSFETSWNAIQNSAAFQRQLLESSLDKAHPPPSKDACDTRFEKAGLGDLFCKVACGGSAAPDAGTDTSECKRSLQSDSQADSFDSQAQEVRDMICEDWTALLPDLRDDDAAKHRMWSRYVDVAVGKANNLLVEGFTAPYSLALDSQQRLVTWSKQAYDLCVADSKWYNNLVFGAAASGWRGAKGLAHRFLSAGAEQSSPSTGQIIEEKAKQIKLFLHNATCPVVDAVIKRAASFTVPSDFLDAVLLQDFKKEYLEQMESFKQSIKPVCENPNAAFVSVSTRLVNLGFDVSTAAMSGIPAGLAAAAIMWQGVGQGDYAKLLEPESIVLVMTALRSVSYLAKRAADGYVTGSESCQRIAKEALGVESDDPDLLELTARPFGPSDVCR